MEWIYGLPNWLFFSLITSTTVAFAVVGMYLTRPWILSHADRYEQQNDLVSYFLGACGVIYGIALGLVAAGVWSNFQTLSGQVDEEASIVAALYQDVGAYPEPQRQVLKADLYHYVQVVIQQDWPLLREGHLPRASTGALYQFKRRLFGFIPTDAGIRLIHEQALVQYNDLAKVRRSRLQGSNSSLPPVMWLVIVLGAAVNIIITWFFVTRPLAFHVVLTLLVAFLLGSLLALTAAMDNPFRGDFSVGPDSFEQVLSQMRPA